MSEADQGKLDRILEAKKAKLQEAMETTAVSEMEIKAPAGLSVTISLYDSFEVGEICQLKRNRVRWIAPGPTWRGPDLFEFVPKKTQPFDFAPPQAVQSHHDMYTDIGTIPRIAGVFRQGLTPWGNAPAYLIHDWEFELHHCGRTNKTFEQVRDTMMQCVKTLMEGRSVPKSPFDFWLLYQAIDF